MMTTIAVGTTVAIGAVAWEVVRTIRRAVRLAGGTNDES